MARPILSKSLVLLKVSIFRVWVCVVIGYDYIKNPYKRINQIPQFPLGCPST